ncbi:hypothetical protein [Microscilla marina]|uniref:Uncharacterized protein n=1 Tax=Microscilla marina ATCC 23134 TaxID=313606 RepID=A1ZLM3_MICM2|nr:hypothetical protein [Microscilla marina]EAY28777.1 hypothetical protein M23134_07875 [Microscilla marina ATCC 23134]
MKNSINKEAQPTATAIQQLAENFASLDQVMQRLDALLHRLTWAYVGKPPKYAFMVYDIDLVKRLKAAIYKDLQKVYTHLHYSPPPLLPPEPNDYNVAPSLLRPAITSKAKADRIAKTRGMTKYKVMLENGKAVLELDWTAQDFDNYYKSGGKLWGNHGKNGLFIARLLHLM